MKILSIGVLALGVSALSSAANLTSAFSITNGNPNGNWSYGLKSTTTGAFTLFNTPSTVTIVSPAATFDLWNLNGGPQPSVAKLTSGTVNGLNGGVGGIAVGEVAMHGSSIGELAVIRYTAPTTGLFDLSGFFKSGDGIAGQYGRIDGYLYLNSTALYSTLNTAVTQTFSLSSVSLTAGDTLDLMVGIGNDTFLYDSTPVDLTITAVPEPASWAVLALGGAMVLRRRKSA